LCQDWMVRENGNFKWSIAVSRLNATVAEAGFTM
jgi:hypothetical protein